MRALLLGLAALRGALALTEGLVESEPVSYEQINSFYPENMFRPHEYNDRLYGPVFAPGLFMLETPVMVYTTLRDFQLAWNCVAVHSPQFSDCLTKEAPVYRTPTGTHTSYDRALCTAFAMEVYAPHLHGGATKMKMTEKLNEFGLSDNILSMGQYNAILACVLMEEGTEDCLTNMAPGENASRRRHAAFAGGVVAAGIYVSMTEDHWNFNGMRDGTNKCDRPFCDWTGYEAPNNPWTLEEITGWQPLIEDNGKGFYYAQEHVTPHIKDQPPFGVTEEMMARTTPDPEYDLDAEMQLAYDRVAALAGDDRRIAISERMDNKIIVFATILNTMAAKYTFSMEMYFWVCLGYITAEHDGVVATWKEKVRHSLVRPTSYSKHVVEEKEVPWYTGENVSSKLWTPFIRVMPHAEYPSGSASICTTSMEYSDAFLLDVYGDESIATTWQYPPMSTKWYPGYPKEHVTEVHENLESMRDQCGASRLWGGMHFTASVQAAIDLVDGFGTVTYAYTKELLNGGSIPARPLEKACGVRGKLTGNPQTTRLRNKKVEGVTTACKCRDACLIKVNNANGFSFQQAGNGNPRCLCTTGYTGTSARNKSNSISGPIE